MADRMRPFGRRRDGEEVTAITLNSGALRATILSHGAVLQDLRLAGAPWGLILGSDQLAAYEQTMGYFGAIVGPVANRIGGAHAEIGDRPHRFAANEGPNLLHGGTHGTHAQNWRILDHDAERVRLGLDLSDGFGGFPGNRKIIAEYRLDGTCLEVRLSAETDAPTLINLAHHGYWNLDGAGDISGHRLRVAADHYLPVDAAKLPTGEMLPVSGPFDLRAGPQLDLGAALDHNFCLAATRTETPREIAELTGTKGVTMTIVSDAPGLQVYDGRGIDTAPHIGHQGQPYGAFAGLALEPQHWPDAPHQPSFPTIALGAGARYEQISRFCFRRAQGS